MDFLWVQSYEIIIIFSLLKTKIKFLFIFYESFMYGKVISFTLCLPVYWNTHNLAWLGNKIILFISEIQL